MGDTDLMHYGVKGMRWGRRDADDLVGDHTFAPPKKSGSAGGVTAVAPPPPKPRSPKAAQAVQVKADAYQAQAKKIAKHANVDSETLRAKYEDRPPRFTPEQKAKAKKIAIGTAIVGTVAVGALGFAAYKTSPRILAAGKEEVDFLMEKKGKFNLGALSRIGKANPNLLKSEAEIAAVGRGRILGILKKEKDFAAQLHPNDYGLFNQKSMDDVVKGGNLDNIKRFLGRKEVLQDFNVSEKDKLEGLFQALRKSAANEAQNPTAGLKMHWRKGVELPEGSVIKRLSSVAEKEVRPGGFYAAHRDQDVQSYKALLPSFWEGWGVGHPSAGGFVNHYEAGAAVKAPSGKESVAIFKSLIRSDNDFAIYAGGSGGPHRPDDPKAILQKSFARGLRGKKLNDTFIERSIDWSDKRDNPMVKRYFDEIRKRGYNSLIDFNDAGKVSKQPIRVLDHSIFKIIKNEPQTLDDFYKAAQAWSPKLVHILETGSDFIEHYLRD